ncbi:methionine aminopeptidase [Erwiniaceae bacterium L1_54_6]|nr:methionine aminopeptidase [Erwiniaceae bacterium L1_54_6]
MRYNKTEAYKKIIAALSDYDIEFEATDAKSIRVRVFLDCYRLTCVRLPVITYCEWKSPSLLKTAIFNGKQYLQNEIENLGDLSWTNTEGKTGNEV